MTRRIIAGILLFLAVWLAFPWLVQEIQDAPGRRIIHSFMEARGIELMSGTLEHKMLMRKIVWGEIPQLAGEHTEFIQNRDELSAVINYAWKYSGYKALYGGYDEPGMGEAQIPTESNK